MTQATSEFLSLFQKVRRAGCPLVGISSPDYAATINLISAHCGTLKDGSQAAIIAWDVSRGFWTLPNNQPGLAAIAEMGADKITDASQAIESLENLPFGSMVFVLNAHKFFGDVVYCQAISNLRDQFKKNKRCLILLGPSFTLPAEMQSDVTLLTEELPTSAELAQLVTGLYKSAKLPEPSPEVLAHAVEALSGLAAFPAEQVTAMSLTTQGVNLKDLWSRKKTQVEQSQGLKMETDEVRLSDVKDADNAVSFISRYLKNVSGILFIDEIEKVMAGAQSDSSGVSQKMHGILLSWMADRKAKGILFTGVQGTGKSMTAKAAGNAEGKPVIRFDMAAMESSLVGESSHNLINNLKVVDSVCQGRVLVIATSNNPKLLSPELRSRFRQGTFFFDSPSAEGRKLLWKQYAKQFQLDSDVPGFNDAGWTGREIMTCCELAHDLEVSLLEASRYIVPVSKSNPEALAAMRADAKGRYISAAKPGIYEPSTDRQLAAGRTVELAEA